MSNIMEIKNISAWPLRTDVWINVCKVNKQQTIEFYIVGKKCFKLWKKSVLGMMATIFLLSTAFVLIWLLM